MRGTSRVQMRLTIAFVGLTFWATASSFTTRADDVAEPDDTSQPETSWLGRPIDEWGELIVEGDTKEQQRARQALSMAPANLQAEAARHRVAAVRRVALEFLTAAPHLLHRDDTALKAVDVLATAANDSESPLQQPALTALGKLAPHYEEQVVPVLIEVMQRHEALTDECSSYLLQTESGRQAGAKQYVESLQAIPVDKQNAVRLRRKLAGLRAAKEHGLPALPLLLKLLHKGPANLRGTAMYAMGNIGPPAREKAMPAILKALERDPRLGRQAILPLLMLEASDDVTVPLARRLLTTGDRGTRASTLFILQQYGPAAEKLLPMLLEVCSDETWVDRHHFAACLARWGTAARPGAGRVAAMLGDEDINVRRKAVYALSQIKPQAPEVLKQMVSHLGVADPGKGRRHADLEQRFYDQLEQTLVEAGEPVVPLLIDALEGDDDQAAGAASTLGRIGPPAAVAVPDLLKASKRPETSVQREVAAALGKLGVANSYSEVAAALRRLLLTPDVAEAAGGSLPILKTAALPIIQAGLSHPRREVRIAAAKAAGQLGPQAAKTVPQVMALLEDPLSRTVAVQVLGNIGMAAYKAAPQLEEIVDKSTGEQQLWAALSLIELDADPQEAIPLLLKGLASPHAVKQEALLERAVNTLGPKAVPLLLEQLESKDYRQVAGGARGLRLLRETPPRAVEPLVESLKSQTNSYAQRELIAALGSLGSAARPATDVLLDAAGDEHRLVSRAARGALHNIWAEAMPSDAASAAP